MRPRMGGLSTPARTLHGAVQPATTSHLSECERPSWPHAERMTRPDAAVPRHCCPGRHDLPAPTDEVRASDRVDRPDCATSYAPVTFVRRRFRGRGRLTSGVDQGYAVLDEARLAVRRDRTDRRGGRYASGASPSSVTPDSFYSYNRIDPLTDLAPGTVLKTRTVATTFLASRCRSPWLSCSSRTDQVGGATAKRDLGRAAAAAARPVEGSGLPVAYDSLNPAASRRGSSRAGSPWAVLPSAETALIRRCAAGYTVVVADTRGPTPTRRRTGIRPEHPRLVAGQLRLGPPPASARPRRRRCWATRAEPLPTEWAAELAPAYAPTSIAT